ncbi:MAG: hypothetical protein MJ250_03765 [Alphaproteobacteria bacterium]|nr:hypothetical protein [Alphaproteobacteria bacterium]
MEKETKDTEVVELKDEELSAITAGSNSLITSEFTEKDRYVCTGKISPRKLEICSRYAEYKLEN